MDDLLLTASMFALALGVPVAAFAGHALGRSKGYREQREITAPLIESLENALAAETRLSAALRENVAASKHLVSVLNEQVDAMKRGQEADEETITTQRSHIELLQSLPQ